MMGQTLFDQIPGLEGVPSVEILATSLNLCQDMNLSESSLVESL